MNENDYCNMINEAINKKFREENEGCDSDVFVDERIENGVIALNWHTFLDSYITYDYIQRVTNYIFASFPDVKQILTPGGDFKR